MLPFSAQFYATEAGRQHFADQLTSIRYCVQETCNFDALYAYLTCGNYDFNYDRLKNLRPRKNIRAAMNHEIQMFACAQKEQQGLDKAVEECSASTPATADAAPLLTLVALLRRRVPDVAVRCHAQRAHPTPIPPRPPVRRRRGLTAARWLVRAQMLIIPPQLAL